MSKAILVLDEMPQNCEECPLEHYMDTAGFVCGALSGVKSCICEMWEDKDKKGRLSACPIRELPDKHETLDDIDYDAGFIDGWNACIDEISGKEVQE